MKFKQIKNRLQRITFKKIENQLLVLRFIIRNENFPLSLRWRAAVYLSSYKQKTKTKIKNRCMITGRSLGYIKFFGLSRLMVLKLYRNGDLALKRLCW